MTEKKRKFLKNFVHFKFGHTRGPKILSESNVNGIHYVRYSPGMAHGSENWWPPQYRETWNR